MGKSENRQAVARAFIDQRPGVHTSGNMSSTSTHAFSYDEVIARRERDGLVLVRTKKFSVTTTQHTNAVRRALEAAGYEHFPLEDSGQWEAWALASVMNSAA